MSDMKTIGEISKNKIMTSAPKLDLDFIQKQYEFEILFQDQSKGVARYKIFKNSVERDGKGKVIKKGLSEIGKPHMLLKEMDLTTKRLGIYKMIPDNGNTLFQFSQFVTFEIKEREMKSGDYTGRSFKYLERVQKSISWQV